MTFTGRSNEDQSDRSSWSRSVEGRFQRVMAKVTSQDIVDRAITAAKLAVGLPLGYLGHGVKTADQLNITAEVDITDLSATVTVAANRKIKISALVLWQATGGIPTSVINVYRDAVPTAIGRIETESVLDTHYHTAFGFILDVAPSAGSHTYKITMQRAIGAGDIDILAGATYQSWLLVEDIGGV